MTEQQNILLSLIKSALTGKALSLPESFDVPDIFRIAEKHGVDMMAYYGALNCGVDSSTEIMHKELKLVYRNVCFGESQMSEVYRLMEEFEARGISHMPLKGVLLKPLYPHPEMRRMGDADILIKTEQLDTIRRVMKELGYTEKYSSDHELAFGNKTLLVELHKRLIPSYNKDYYGYYGDGWEFARLKDGTSYRYEMKPEDEMIYLLVHLAKHYRDSGIGIRHFADILIFRRHNPKLDEAYIKEELDKLNLFEFYNNILNTVESWFGEYPGDEKTELITQFVFAGGEYGDKRNSSLSSALKTIQGNKSAGAVKRSRIIGLLFPKYADMCKLYPVLNKASILLPFMWVVRVLSRMFKVNKMRKYANESLKFSDDDVMKYKRDLNFVGLNYDFSE